MRASAYTLAGLLGLARYRDAEREAVDLARSWLDKVNLLGQADWDAGNLPYGAQRRLEIARAMCTGPILLCLDEPADGRKISDGTPDSVRADPVVIRAYLGEEEDEALPLQVAHDLDREDRP